MALLFSKVTVDAEDKQTEFLVGGIPREYDDLEGWTAFDELIGDIDEETEIGVHAEAYLYGGEETYKASLEEVAYFMKRIEHDDKFLSEHCDNIESVDFRFNYMPQETTIIGADAYENIIFTQPGMRYCQAQALIHSLMKDDVFKDKSEAVKDYICERILDEVKGRMLEDIILMETSKKLSSKQYKVFKLKVSGGEFDMVIYDRNENVCGIYEIKHSDKFDENQYRHLSDEEKCEQTERRFGKIVSKTVLYRGEDFETEEGILYRNAEKYLKELTNEFSFEIADEDIVMQDGMTLM